MTVKLESTISKAVARVKAAQAKRDAAEAAQDDGAVAAVCGVVSDAFDRLVATPCRNDAEFLEKLKFMIESETRLYGSPFESRAEFASIANAVAAYVGQTETIQSGNNG